MIDVVKAVVVFLSILFSSTCAAITSFGGAILFHVGWQVAGMLGLLEPNLQEAVTLLSLDIVALPLFLVVWREVDWYIFLHVFPPALVTLFVGFVVLLSFKATVLKPALGVILLVFAVWKFWDEFVERDQLKRLLVWAKEVLLCRRGRSLSEVLTSERAAEEDKEVEEGRRARNKYAALKEEGAEEKEEEEDDVPEREVENGEAKEKEATEKAIEQEPTKVAAAEDKAEIAEELEADVLLKKEQEDEDEDVHAKKCSSQPTSLPQPSCAASSSSLLGRLSAASILSTRPWLRVLAVLCGLVSGFLLGLYGTGGPPMMVFVTVARMDKGPLRASMTALWAALLPFRTGYLLFYKGLFRWEDIANYAAVITGCLAGMFIGDRLHHRVDTRTVLRIILFLLFCASLSMLNVPLTVMVWLVIACLLALAAFLLWSFRYRIQRWVLSSRRPSSTR
ncbi:A-kinase anchor protein 13-like [Balamuthia mandrillaris]